MPRLENSQNVPSVDDGVAWVSQQPPVAVFYFDLAFWWLARFISKQSKEPLASPLLSPLSISLSVYPSSFTGSSFPSFALSWFFLPFLPSFSS
jgi:hypothetical protein